MVTERRGVKNAGNWERLTHLLLGRLERHLKSCVFAPASFCQNEGVVENSGANTGKAMYKDGDPQRDEALTGLRNSS